jgi:hypothetical protein
MCWQEILIGAASRIKTFHTLYANHTYNRTGNCAREDRQTLAIKHV